MLIFTLLILNRKTEVMGTSLNILVGCEEGKSYELEDCKNRAKYYFVGITFIFKWIDINNLFYDQL